MAAASAQTIEQIEIDGDVVLFSLNEPKSHTIPACVAQGNEQLWSLSLASESGRAMYSLMLTAMAKSESTGVVIESAGDCEISLGIEHARAVNIVNSSKTTPINGSSRIGAYKSDGVTRLGAYVGLGYSQWRMYLDPNEPETVKSMEIGHRNTVFYFADNECLSTPVSNSQNGTYLRAPGYQNGRIFSRGEGFNSNYSSRFSQGECIETGGSISGWLMEPAESELCGQNLCILKEE